LDLAGIGVGLVDLVIVADGMIKERHTSPARLIEAAAQWSGKDAAWQQSRVTRPRRRGFAAGDGFACFSCWLASEPRVNLIAFVGGMAAGAGSTTWWRMFG
jgi:hypothetical protein